MPRVKPESLATSLHKSGDTRFMQWDAAGRIMKREQFEFFDVVQLQCIPQPLLQCLVVKKATRNTLALCNSTITIICGGTARLKFERNYNIASVAELPKVKQEKPTCYWINHEPYIWFGKAYLRSTFHMAMTWKLDYACPCFEPSITDMKTRFGIEKFEAGKTSNQKNAEMEEQLQKFKKSCWTEKEEDKK